MFYHQKLVQKIWCVLVHVMYDSDPRTRAQGHSLTWDSPQSEKSHRNNKDYNQERQKKNQAVKLSGKSLVTLAVMLLKLERHSLHR